MNKRNDLGDALKTLQGFVFTFHRGYRGTKTSSGIEFKGETYATIELFQKAVDDYIREGGIKLGNSLNKNK